MRIPKSLLTAVVAAGLGLAAPAQAAPVTYTDKAAFDAAIAALSVSVLDFEGLAAPASFASGTTFSGITFSYDDDPGLARLFEVSTGSATTSGVNYLGTDDAGLLQDDPADWFTLGFASANAIGMFFITIDEMFDGDIVLSAGGADALLDSSAVFDVLGDGASVYFLGIVDTAATFTAADVTTIGGGFFLYNVDDIVTARERLVQAPEPAGGALLALGLLVMAACGRRRSAA